MRVTDEYIWNIIFLFVFLLFVAGGMTVLSAFAYRDIGSFSFTDYALVSLASARLVRLVVYDRMTAFFREQFLDSEKTESGTRLVKPRSGVRRGFADLVLCPWCVGVWASASVLFFYLLTPLALFPTVLIALSAVATLIQLAANLLGWMAEAKKREVEEG